MNEPNMKTINQIKQELRDIIELSDKATLGPWEVDSANGVMASGIGWIPVCYPFGDKDTEKKDASFIAASRNLTPKMARALLGTLEILEHMTTYTTKAGTVAINTLETIRREWEVQP